MPVSRRRKRRRTNWIRRDAVPDRLASRGRRIVAAFLDRCVLLWIAFYATMAVAATRGVDPFEDGSAWWFAPIAVVMAVNEFVGTAFWGQTIGKRLLRIRVIRFDNYAVPGLRRAVIRTFGLMPLGWVPYGAMAAEMAATFFFSKRRQALHDMMSGTIVVDDTPWRKWIERSLRKRAA